MDNKVSLFVFEIQGHKLHLIFFITLHIDLTIFKIPQL
jgi:hypothetical protein